MNTQEINRDEVRNEIRFHFGHAQISFTAKSIKAVIDTKWENPVDLRTAVQIVINRTPDLYNNKAYVVVDDSHKYGDFYSAFTIKLP